MSGCNSHCFLIFIRRPLAPSSVSFGCRVSYTLNIDDNESIIFSHNFICTIQQSQCTQCTQTHIWNLLARCREQCNVPGIFNSDSKHNAIEMEEYHKKRQRNKKEEINANMVVMSLLVLMMRAFKCRCHFRAGRGASEFISDSFVANDNQII